MDKYKKIIFDYDHWYDDKMDRWFDHFAEYANSNEMVHVDCIHDVLMEMLKEIGTEIDKELDNE